MEKKGAYLQAPTSATTLKLLLPLLSWNFVRLLSFVHVPKLWTLNPSQSFELLKLSLVRKL
jgi:hypothetical protein